jgi:hypothetical protein
MNKLIELGFEQVGITSLKNGKLEIEISRNEHAKNILYAFVHEKGEDEIDWQVVYIGHTRKSLKNRMLGYRLGNGQATNNRVHNHLKSELGNGSRHYVYVLHDKINLNIHSIEVDLAAGLEYSLIQFYANYNFSQGHVNLFNIAGNKNNPQNENVEVVFTEMHEENIDYPVDENQDNPVVQTFDYSLGKTYWNHPYLNIPTRFEGLFGRHGDVVAVDFFHGGELIRQLEVVIDRNAVNNSAPRLYFPTRNGVNFFQDWKHDHFREGDTMSVTIVGRNHLSFNL